MNAKDSEHVLVELPVKASPRRPVVEILDPMIVEILRRKTPAERLAQAFHMWETATLIIRSSVRQQHLDWSEEQILQEAARRLSHGATERVPH